MTDMENREQIQPQEGQPSPVEQNTLEQNASAHSAPQPAQEQVASEQAEPAPAPQPNPQPNPQPEPIPQPAWEKPTPQLTLEPDLPPEPFQMPEPPKAPDPSQAVNPQPNPQPVQYATYNYNFNTAPEQSYPQQGQPGYDPNYQPPNYTAQSYQPQPQQQPKYTTPPAGYRQKSRIAAGILAFMLGTLGVHNFYLGFNTRGTIQLVIALAGGLVTCGMATVVVAIWGLVDAVNLLSATTPKFDGNGVILRD